MVARLAVTASVLLLLTTPALAWRDWSAKIGHPEAGSSTTAAANAKVVIQTGKGRKKSVTVAAKTATTQVPQRASWRSERAPNAPRVSYADGELTIDADNSTLYDVLSSVRRMARIGIEVPSAAANDRVFVRIGPGSPNTVLNSLLSGTQFDYIILGTIGHPGAVERVILTARNDTAPPNAGQVAQPGAGAPNPQVIGQPKDDESAGEPDVEPEQPDQDQPQAQPEPQPQPQGENNPDRPKTPEELLEELRQLQQQQQQQQQQQNPPDQK